MLEYCILYNTIVFVVFYTTKILYLYKDKHTHTYTKGLYVNVNSGFIHNSQKLETVLTSIIW